MPWIIQVLGNHLIKSLRTHISIIMAGGSSLTNKKSLLLSATISLWRLRLCSVFFVLFINVTFCGISALTHSFYCSLLLTSLTSYFVIFAPFQLLSLGSMQNLCFRPLCCQNTNAIIMEIPIIAQGLNRKIHTYIFLLSSMRLVYFSAVEESAHRAFYIVVIVLYLSDTLYIKFFLITMF